MKRTLAALATLTLLGLPLQAEATAKKPKAGQFCAAKDAGKKSGNLRCAKDGDRYRWKR